MNEVQVIEQKIKEVESEVLDIVFDILDIPSDVDESKLETFYCTFGWGQENWGKYCIVKAPNENGAKALMFAKFKNKWSMVYPEDKYSIAIEPWGYELLEVIEWYE